MELSLVTNSEVDVYSYIDFTSVASSCARVAMVQNVSKIEVKSEEAGVLHTSFQETDPWTIFMPAERATLQTMCIDVSWKKRECKPEVSKTTPSVNGCHKARREKIPEASTLVTTQSESIISEPVLTGLLRPGIAGEMVPAMSASEYHVLVVDDSIIDQTLVARLLKTSSYKVTRVNSALKAMEVLGLSESCPTTKSINVNLIITDYCMPEMTGYDLLKQVKAQGSALRETPVVIMSSENDADRIQRCLEEGAEEFIIKPVQMSDVKRLRGHIRPLRRSLSSGSRESSSSSLSSSPSPICAKRKVGSPDALQVTSPERRPRFSGVTVVA